LATLYIRHPARAEGEGAACRFALVGDGGAIEQRGEGPLRSLSELVAASRRVVLLLAATDVTLLTLQVPPLTGARLKAALPGLVEEHILGDPAEAVLVAGPVQPDRTRPVAVVQRDWLESLVRGVLAQGARTVAALPSQLCLPLQPGSVSAAIGDGELILRQGLYQGLGLGLDGPPAAALQTARALAGDMPLVLFVPPDQLGEYHALAAEAGPGIALEADDWAHWVAGAKTTNLDLVPGIGAAAARSTDWRRWRWPIGLAALAVVVTLAGLNIEWLRLRGEEAQMRQAITQAFRSAYPRDPVSTDPALQMRQNIARAKAANGQLGPDEFTWLAAAFGEAVRELKRPPNVVSIEYRERTLTVKVKPESVDPSTVNQLKTALSARGLRLEEAAPATWLIRSTGAKV
jgi:general secretion pathway protein L